MPIIVRDPEFILEKAIKHLPPHRLKQVIKALEKFSQNPRYPSLKFRKYQGSDNEWIINANEGDRILLLGISETDFEITDIDTHDLYRRQNR